MQALAADDEDRRAGRQPLGEHPAAACAEVTTSAALGRHADAAQQLGDRPPGVREALFVTNASRIPAVRAAASASAAPAIGVGPR